ncbi:hypothetical protein [Streptosporangium sp. NPDC051022]|uniref:hypothetical protein n=1 Tax=Streptosporangium sp. NPDC051022 TaxID=3155752 RepID=UPI0034425CF9
MTVHQMRKELALMFVVVSAAVLMVGFCTGLVAKNFSLPGAFEATLDMGPGLLIVTLATSLGVTVGRLSRFMKSGD